MFIICLETNVAVREPPQVHSLQCLLQYIKIQLLFLYAWKIPQAAQGLLPYVGGAAATDKDPISA